MNNPIIDLLSKVFHCPLWFLLVRFKTVSDITLHFQHTYGKYNKVVLLTIFKCYSDTALCDKVCQWLATGTNKNWNGR
jgi:hypothetical protein